MAGASQRMISVVQVPPLQFGLLNPDPGGLPRFFFHFAGDSISYIVPARGVLSGNNASRGICTCIRT